MLRLDSATKLKWEKHPTTGLLTAFITLGVADKPLEYYEPRADGKGFEKTIEAITLEELTREDSITSARGLPINLGHPASGRHNQNKEGLLVGSTLQEVAVDDGSLVLAATFHDQRADRLIKEAQERADGLFPEISPGYSIDKLVRVDGVGLQIRRIYDHAALLLPGEGRGAQDVRVRLDAADRVAADLVPEPVARNFYSVDSRKKKPMPIISIGKRVYNLDDASDLTALKPAVEKLAEDLEAAETLATESEAKATAATAELTAAKERADSIKKELDAAKGRADAADTKIKELQNTRVDAAAIAADRKAAIETWQLVTPTLRADNKDFTPDYALDVADIQKLYLAAKNPDLKLDEASPDYIKGAWDLLKPSEEVRTDAAKAVDALGAIVDQTRGSREDASSYAMKEKAKKRAERIKANGNKSTMGAA